MMSANPDEHWASLRERGAFWGLRIMFGTYRLLGRRVFAWLLRPVVVYFYLSNRSARRSSLTFLRRVHAESSDEAEGRPPSWFDGFRHFLSFGEALGDKIAAWAGDIRLDDLDRKEAETLEALHRAGRGGILIGCHLGNMEVTRAIATQIPDLRITALVHTRHSRNFTRLMQRVAPESTLSVLQTSEITPTTAMLLSERVARGEFVVIAGDRTPVGRSSRVSWAPFLGHPAPFPQGPYILAGLLKSPVLLAFCVKRGRQHHLSFEPFSDGMSLPRHDRAAWAEEWARRYAARLEHHCKASPLQWFNFFDFWKQASADVPAPSTAAGSRRVPAHIRKSL
jgi:predicted LPLAT superfamily acyltransferase